MDPSNIDLDAPELHQDLASLDHDSPIVHMRQFSVPENPSISISMSGDPMKRMSGSSLSMSTAGDFSSTEDLPTSEAVSHISDWESSFDPASTWMSPMTSPRHTHAPFEPSRRGSRSRASPASQHSVRPSPYGGGSDRSKRWTIGTSVPSSSLSSSHAVNHMYDRFPGSAMGGMPHHSASAYNLHAPHSHQPQTQNVYYAPSGFPHPTNGMFFGPAERHPHQVAPRPLPSQGLFRMLHSSTDGHGHPFAAAAESATPPDLYSSLNEQPEDPPEEDMHPSDPDLVPHEQDLRFAGDLYTPKWVRGHGNKREGWCGLCKPGRWLVLKNSAFWYDKSFTHGVSAATGAAFKGPQETRRTEGNADIWEGYCGSCGDWISLVSSKKKGTTWFRHAYKCHTHPKVKDGPKRRRETPASMRARAASNASGSTTATTTTAGTSSPASRFAHPDESPVLPSVESSEQQQQHSQYHQQRQAQLDAEIRARLQGPSVPMPSTTAPHLRTGHSLDGFAGMI
ncbi:MAG: hypothetical protein M1821_001861 [Bathelium mastoideum]|nr:MAG: hypothetical protein M1821_001861 [Bathelium mastoideum]